MKEVGKMAEEAEGNPGEAGSLEDKRGRWGVAAVSNTTKRMGVGGLKVPLGFGEKEGIGETITGVVLVEWGMSDWSRLKR